MQQELFRDLGIGTRLKRVYDLLSIDMERLYKEAGLEFRVRYFPVVFALHKLDGLTIAQMQKRSGLTHSALSQTVKQLMDKDIVEMQVGEDARSRIVRLTANGQDLLKQLLPIWRTAERVIQDVRQSSQNDLLLALGDFEQQLQEKGFYQRYTQYNAKASKAEVEIVPFHVKYRQDWHDINKEWVERFFTMEQPDRDSLENPEKYILGRGGEIYFALHKGKVVGVAALKYDGEDVYEVSKMGVRPEAQGLGIGRRLLSHTIERFHARGGRKLYLETNSKLAPAISLYEKAGFVQVPAREDTPYARADVCMEYQRAI